jgi:Region found in RelA / SpoT proteins
MSYFFRRLYHFAKWDEEAHPRGKTTPESNDGSFAPKGAAGEGGAPKSKQQGFMHLHEHVQDALSKIASFCNVWKERAPNHTHQPGIGRNDKEELIAQARASKPLFDTWARGVASVFDAKVFDTMVDGKKPTEQAIEYAKANPDTFALLLAGIKGDPRLSEKIRDEYDGDCSLVKDMVRGTIAVPDASRIDDVLEVLENAGLELATVPKDRINNPGEEGYRDVKLNVLMPNGHIAELQVMTHSILEAKEILGHALYEEERVITGLLMKEQRDPTPEENAKLKVIRKRMRDEVYDPAWERSLQVVGA